MAVFMRMPKTPVYENYSIVFGKYKVWFARISFITNTVAKAGFEKGRADLFFRLCVFGTDVRHVFVAIFGGQNIHIYIIADMFVYL